MLLCLDRLTWRLDQHELALAGRIRFGCQEMKVLFPGRALTTFIIRLDMKANNPNDALVELGIYVFGQSMCHDGKRYPSAHRDAGVCGRGRAARSELRYLARPPEEAMSRKYNERDHSCPAHELAWVIKPAVSDADIMAEAL
jgi:hypothetical protein